MTDHYVGDGETLPTTPAEALDLLSGFYSVIAEEDDERPDIDEAFAILDRLIQDAGTIIVAGREPGTGEARDEATRTRYIGTCERCGYDVTDEEPYLEGEATAAGYGLQHVRCYDDDPE